MRIPNFTESPFALLQILLIVLPCLCLLDFACEIYWFRLWLCCLKQVESAINISVGFKVCLPFDDAIELDIFHNNSIFLKSMKKN